MPTRFCPRCRPIADNAGTRFAGGHELSGGQWQGRRLPARSIATPLVIIDWPTAASMRGPSTVDLLRYTRAARRSATDHLPRVSQRYEPPTGSTFLDHGRVVEQGTHDELVALGGQYAELFHLQASAYSVDRIEIDLVKPPLCCDRRDWGRRLTRAYG